MKKKKWSADFNLGRNFVSNKPEKKKISDWVVDISPFWGIMHPS